LRFLNQHRTKFLFNKKDDVKAIVTLGSALKFNGGGHLNHSIFWTILCPKGTSEPIGKKANLFKKI
jgi:Fe-Mn family superoxide dismutase